MSTTQIHYNAAKYGQSGRKPHVLSLGRYNSIWTFTFSAKERDTETGYSVTSLRLVSSSSLSQAQTSLAWHSLIRRFGSRYYSSDLSIWLSVDPQSDKYPSFSPYVYCANNPIKLVDPNGEDYEVVVDNEKKTMTIRAVYYTANENKEKLQKGLDAWNEQSGKYSFVTGKGKDKQSYTINFELTIAEGDYNTSEAASAFNGDKSGFANFVESSNEITNCYNEPINGEATNNVIHFRPEASIRTISHEIGHTLGIGDWKSPTLNQEDFGQLMTSGGTSDVINKSHVATILKVKGFSMPSFTNGFTINPSKNFIIATKKMIGRLK